MNAQRYSMAVCNDGDVVDCWMDEDEAGDYVLYDDYVRSMKDLERMVLRYNKLMCVREGDK